jgi:disulfide bond formation protein DsbB
MKNLTTRQLNFAGFIACAGMIGFALYAEHTLMLMPCPLCVFQRMAVIALGIIFLAAALHDPSGWGRRVYAVLILLAAGGGIGVAGRHVWLQNLPPEEVPACGAGYDYLMETLPFMDALRAIFTGSGECAEIDWQFLGLSMPGWVFVSLATLGLAGLWNALRSTRQVSESIA